MLLEILLETLKRTLGLAVVIVLLLLIVEYLNHKYGDKLIHFFEKRQKFLPFWAAVFGLLPGCNAAAAIGLLYVRGYMTIGALIAAMIATSDEAIYVFLPQKFNFLPLYAAKFAIALLAGFTVDIFYRARQKKRGVAEMEYCCSVHHHEHLHDFSGMLRHTFQHAAKIVFFIFIVLFAFNFLKDTTGFNDFVTNYIQNNQLQPIVAAIFGLIPGCGTSVVLATLYTQGILSFAGAVAGLSVASGDTLLVLLANKISKKQLTVITGTVIFASIISAYLLTFI